MRSLIARPGSTLTFDDGTYAAIDFKTAIG